MVAALIVSSLSRSDIKIQPAMPLKSRQQDGGQRLEAFRAEAVGCFPQRYQCLPNICAIAHWMRHVPREGADHRQKPQLLWVASWSKNAITLITVVVESDSDFPFLPQLWLCASASCSAIAGPSP